MKIRAFTLGLLVVSLGGASQLLACGGDEGEPGLDGGGSSGAQQASSGAASSGAQGASSSSSSGGGGVDGGDGDGGASSSSGSLDDGGTASSDGGADAAVDAGPASNDPFDPAGCAGAAWPAADALASLDGARFHELARATVMSRKRTCAGNSVADCGPWGEPTVHEQPLLTYSGGVTTDYKTFSFPTALFLYNDAGVAKYSVRHVLDVAHTPNDVAHGIVFSSANAPMVNAYPVIYVWDPAPAANRYQALEGRLGDQAALFVGPSCARYIAPRSLSEELAALYRY